MGFFWKKYTIQFSLQTKDNKQFRYVYIDFEQKRNLFTFKNNILHKYLKECIQEWFLIWINFNDMFEGKNPFRLIDEQKLQLVNSHINTMWNMDYQPNIKEGKIRNIQITYLIR